MDTSKDFFIIAYYCFTSISDPDLEVAKHKEFFQNRDIKSRIYISKEGINAQMSAKLSHAEEYMSWMKSDERFAQIDFKIHSYHEHVFPKATVKVREQLVALDIPVDPKEGGEHISPEKWKEMLDNRDSDTLLLDVRNDYEWKVGRFENSTLPPLEAFREFPKYAKELKEKHDPSKTKVMMYCTGGIRCELYSVLLKKEGFENVYQLDGGVIKYGQQAGAKHWEGKLFVFDDRLAVAVSEKESAKVIGECHHCNTSADAYHNCANMDCNELFICCPTCGEKFQGCCSTECQNTPRLRPYQQTDYPKPFRKWYHYSDSK